MVESTKVVAGLDHYQVDRQDACYEVVCGVNTAEVVHFVQNLKWEWCSSLLLTDIIKP